MRPVIQIKFLFLIFTIANGQNKIHKSSLKSIEYSVTTEINYAGNMNMAQTLDVYIPKHKKNEKLPVIVNIHGESILWGNGDKMWGGDTPFSPSLQLGGIVIILK